MKGYYLIELIRRLVNETPWVLGNLCMCCNVEMVNNCSLYMRIHHYQHMTLLFVHQHIETDICLQESMELLIITAPIKLICRTNVSYNYCIIHVFGGKVTHFMFLLQLISVFFTFNITCFGNHILFSPVIVPQLGGQLKTLHIRKLIVQVS